MGIEQMRGNYGRYPPFLFGGLLLVCLISTVQWWSLATQNNDLIRQLEDLGEKFKLSSDQREQCLQLRMVLDNRLKNTEDELAQVKVRLEKLKVEMNNMKTQESQKDDELKTQMKNADDAQSAAAMCRSELESQKKLDIAKDGTIDSLRIEKNKYSSKVDEKDKDIAKLKSELEAVRQELNILKADKQAPKLRDPAVNNVQRSQLKKQPLVDVRVKGLVGMLSHDPDPIIIRDPPNAPRPPPRFSVTHLKGNQVGEQDDNHGGEREDGEEVPALPDKKSLPLSRKSPTKSSIIYNEGNINDGIKDPEEKEDNNHKEENNQVKPPEPPAKNIT